MAARMLHHVFDAAQQTIEGRETTVRLSSFLPSFFILNSVEERLANDSAGRVRHHIKGSFWKALGRYYSATSCSAFSRPASASSADIWSRHTLSTKSSSTAVRSPIHSSASRLILYWLE